MKIDFTKQELKVMEFVIVNDLETLQNMIDENQAELSNVGEYATLNMALAKIRKELR